MSTRARVIEGRASVEEAAYFIEEQEARIAALIEAGETLWQDVIELSRGRLNLKEWNGYAKHGEAFDRARDLS